MSTTYSVARFDHARAARTLYDDLRALKVKGLSLHLEDRLRDSDSGSVWLELPAGIALTDHMQAVRNFSLGRGSHTVVSEVVQSIEE